VTVRRFCTETHSRTLNPLPHREVRRREKSTMRSINQGLFHTIDFQSFEIGTAIISVVFPNVVREISNDDTENYSEY
jgi:hypothetical protein